MQSAPAHANHRESRRFDEPSRKWVSARWGEVAFDMGERRIDGEVRGELCLPNLTVIATLSGHTRFTNSVDADGTRYRGRDYPGVVTLIPAGAGRRVQMGSGAFIWASLCLPQIVFDKVSHGSYDVRRARPVSNGHEPLIAHALTMIGRMTRHGAVDPLIGEAASIIVARHIVDQYGQAEYGRVGDGPLAPFVLRDIDAFLDAILDQPVTLTDMAGVAGRSISYFSSAFKQTTGLTPYAYVTKKRMQRARELVLRGELSIAEIALECGHSNPGRFAALFRREYGASPREFARSAGVVLEPPAEP